MCPIWDKLNLWIYVYAWRLIPGFCAISRVLAHDVIPSGSLWCVRWWCRARIGPVSGRFGIRLQISWIMNIGKHYGGDDVHLSRYHNVIEVVVISHELWILIIQMLNIHYYLVILFTPHCNTKMVLLTFGYPKTNYTYWKFEFWIYITIHGCPYLFRSIQNSYRLCQFWFAAASWYLKQLPVFQLQLPRY